MTRLIRIGCVLGLLLVARSGVSLLAMDAKEAKPEAQIAKEKKEKAAAEQEAARQRIRAKARKERMVIEAQKKAAAEIKAAAAASQSSSSTASDAALAEESKTAISTPFAGTEIRGLDEDESLDGKAATKEEKAVASVVVQEPAKVEEQATITVKAADGSETTKASEARVALTWLLQLHPIAATFDEQHKTEAKDYKGEVKLCDYSQGDDKVERVAGCPVCDAVVQAWFDDVKTKAQLDVIMSALQVAYEQRMRMTPRDMAHFLVLKLAVKKIDAEALSKLWFIAAKLGLYPLSTATAIQLQLAQEASVKKAAQEVKKEEQEETAEKTRAAFVAEHKFAKPLVEQMAFEQAYAAGKAPALSASILQAYSFFPMQVDATADAVLEAVEKHPRLEVFMGQLPFGKVTIGLRTKMAEQMVEEKGFNQAALDAIPEGHFKYLLRKAYFQKNNQPMDEFPIEKVIEKLTSGPEVDLSKLGLTDVSWLNDELYLLNDKQAIKILYLFDNKLVALPENFLQGCTQLQFLALVSNKLKALPAKFLQGCTKLQKLLLNRNELAALPVTFLQGCAQLQVLFLDRNELAALPENFLQGCAQLQALHISRNELVALPDNFLQGCTQLQQLLLSDNKLAALPDNFLQGCRQLQILWLGSNPWTTQRPDALVKTLRARVPVVDVQYP